MDQSRSEQLSDRFADLSTDELLALRATLDQNDDLDAKYLAEINFNLTKRQHDNS